MSSAHARVCLPTSMISTPIADVSTARMLTFYDKVSSASPRPLVLTVNFPVVNPRDSLDLKILKATTPFLHLMKVLY